MRIAVLLFAAGVLFLQCQPVLPGAGESLFAACCLFLPSLFSRQPLLRRARWLAWFLLGVAWAAWRAEVRLADELGSLWEGRDVAVIGTVATLPQAFERGQRFEFVVERILTPGAVLPGRLQLARYRVEGREAKAGDATALQPGQRWQWLVRLKRPHGGANPGGFDYEAYLLERGIRATGYVRPGDASLLDDFVWRPEHVVEYLRFAVRASFQRLLPGDEWPWVGILVALAVGDQKGVQGDLWSVFNKTGTVHLMSISGLHVTMVAGLFGAAIAFVWRRVPALAQRRPAQQAGLLGAALAAFAYALLAGFGVPAQRTLYMLLVAAAALASGRILAPSRILTLALLVVLLVDPWAVLASGFWLSFGAVAALLYIGSARLDAPGGWRAAILGWGAVQWAATLASLPVLLLIFQQFSLVSPLANALAVPVISFLVAPLALLAAILPWWPVLALAHGILDGLMQFLFYCAAWPVWQTPAPPLWAVLAAALGVAVCLLPRRAPVRPLGFFLLLPALFWPPEPIPEGEARIDVLDVGQGQAVVVRTRHHVLIDDPGPLYGGDADAGQRVVVPYLRWLGVDRIDTLLVTHRDSDHAGGLGSVLSAMPVDELLSSLPEAGGRTCRTGQHWQWDGVDFAVLHPLAEAYARATASNHLSCVLSVTAGRRRVLLTGDIEAIDEAALLARDAGALRAEVLVVPHHGSKTSSSPAFIAAVAPSQVVFSVGYRNRFGHPHPDVAGRYERSGSRAWRTDRDGAIRIELAPAQIALHAWRAERPRYWHGR